MDTTITWVDARLEHPHDGDLVLAAIVGRYPAEPGETPSPEQDFWLVLPTHFRHLYPVQDSDDIVYDCYHDADGVVRRPYGDGSTAEEVTHWAMVPTLPGIPVRELTGASMAPALATALNEPTAVTGDSRKGQSASR